MKKNNAAKFWFTNVVTFLLFSILTFTGLVNWFFLPRGYQTESNFLISIRHLFRQIHEWTALFFIIFIIIHIMLHWSYIKSNLKKYKITK
ncbi:MAG: DUF4405 domain-containing protein [Deltaproteobacteria bacterium]|nr:DUF4405 domain-containing protein [Deltaproteobacteria bacterium]